MSSMLAGWLSMSDASAWNSSASCCREANLVMAGLEGLLILVNFVLSLFMMHLLMRVKVSRQSADELRT